MSGQHCLYCERPLALLSRLTGDGEFCSKEHRKLYQKEHSQLALERLLKAQPQAPPRPLGKAAPPEPGDIVQAEVSTLGKGAAKQASRKPDPPAAAFLAEVVAPAPVSGPVRLAKPPMEEAEIQGPRWKDLPAPPVPRPVYRRTGTAVGAFLQPGCFLRRKIRPAALPAGAEGNLGAGMPEPEPFVLSVPEMNYLEKCMLRTERLGFSPP